MKAFILIAMLGILSVLVVLAAPTMAASVPGVWISGNPTCEELGESLGYNWVGLKIDPVTPGTYSDGTLTVNVVVSGKSFDWTSNIPVSAVFVKGGPGGSLYNYEDAESMGDTNLISLRDTDTKQFGLSHLNFCYDMDPDLDLEVSKDAQTTFVRTWHWDIEKSVDIAQHDLADGETATSTYYVDVYKTGYSDSEWMVSGTITIHNPANVPATIEDVVDEVGGAGYAAVECDEDLPYILAPGEDFYCYYSLALPDGADRLNTVTVSTSGDVDGNSATADVFFGDPTTLVNDEVTVTDSVAGDLGSTDVDETFSYPRDFTCGEDEGTHFNTATIVETGQSDDADVIVTCEALYQLDVSKDAQTIFTRTWEWAIEKSVDIAQHDLADGETGTSTYYVDVYKTGYSDSEWMVSGTITIHNPAPVPATIEDVVDEVSDAGYAAVECDEDLPYILAPGEDFYCYYSLALPDGADRLNTVTVTTSGDVDGNSATADVFFGDLITFVNDEVTVTDSVVGDLGSTDVDETFSYPRDFTCGEDEGTHFNTATIVETGQSDDADVVVTCEALYQLDVSKDAQTIFTRTWEWAIEKSVDIPQHDLADGETATSTYYVDVYKTGYSDSEWMVSGTITIHNPAPVPATIEDVVDEVSDAGYADVECDEDLPYILAPGEDFYCYYSLALPDGADRLNTVTVSTSGDVDGNSATADVLFGDLITFVNDEVTVTDSVVGDLGSTDVDETFSYPRDFTCGEDEGTHFNTATIVETGQSDDADVVVTCDLHHELEVSKDAVTSYTRTWGWTIEKTVDVAQHNLFDGESGTSNYSVVVSKVGFTDSDWLVTGNIWIHNPSSVEATIEDVVDVVSGAGNALVDCGVTFPYELAPNADLHCTYSLALPDGADRLNTVTVTTSGDVDGNSATADVLFGDPTTEVNAEVTVVDTVQGLLGTVNNTTSFTYSRTFTCGNDAGTHPNTATIVETGQSASATVTVSCQSTSQWCSPGYWKQPHHLDSWPIDPNTPYNDVFDPDLPGDPTLLDVISQPEVYGGPITNQIADYLSGLHPDVDFAGERVEDSCPLN